MAVKTAAQAQLIRFLEEDLAVPADSIAIALRQSDYGVNPIPMVLWQYGLITLEQLDRIFDWLKLPEGCPEGY